MSQHLIIDNKNIQLKLEGKALNILYPDRKPASIPLRMLEQVTLLANIEIPVHLLHKLAQHGISISVINPRNQNTVTTCLNHQHLDYARREQQYALMHDRNLCRQASSELVQAKLLSQIQLLQRLAHRRPQFKAEAQHAEKAIHNLLPSVHNMPRSQLLGLEGSAARIYFQAYGSFFNSKWNFNGRNKRPPKDPVNALLSLGYTMLLREVDQTLQRVGLDPAFGFYHKTSHGRSSLACDLLELYRTQIDLFVYQLLAEQVLKPEHFAYQLNACLLTKEGRSRFFPAYQKAMQPCRRALRLTALHWVQRLLATPKPHWMTDEVA